MCTNGPIQMLEYAVSVLPVPYTGYVTMTHIKTSGYSQTLLRVVISNQPAYTNSLSPQQQIVIHIM